MAAGHQDRIDQALARSFLAGLPQETQARVLAGAIRLDVPAGSVLYREAEAPRFGLVVGGLVRIFLTSAQGRQLTVRYARAGAIIGAPTTVGGPVDVSSQAVTESAVLMLNVEILCSRARHDLLLAWMLAEGSRDGCMRSSRPSGEAYSVRSGSASPATCSTWRPIASRGLS